MNEYPYTVPANFEQPGKIRTALFVGLTACATLAAAYFLPKALQKEELARGMIELQYGETVEHAVVSTCDKLVGDGVVDNVATVAASRMVTRNGQVHSVRFQNPTAGTQLEAVCVRYKLPWLNNRG